MAEALTRDKLEDRDLSAAVISAGTMGIVGRKPSDAAVRALKEIGVELSGHLSQGVDVNLVGHADVIAVMEPKHVDYFERRAPDLLDRVVPLWEYADEEIDGIADPVGRSIEAFRTCREMLDGAIDALLDELEGDRDPQHP
jgi:protein-tyrosine phosphatase